MASLNNYTNKKFLSSERGFTLIEIMVVIGIIMIILAFGVTVDLGAFTRGTMQSEEAKIVSVLQRARSHAMANMYESPFGFCYDSPNYVIFHDGSCDGSSTDETIPANENIATASNFATTFPTIVFDQLSGNTDDATIHITDGVKSADITINNEGTINW